MTIIGFSVWSTLTTFSPITCCGSTLRNATCDYLETLHQIDASQDDAQSTLHIDTDS